MRILVSLLVVLLGGCVGHGGGTLPNTPPGRPAPAYADARSVCPNHRLALGSVPFPGEAVAANVRAGQVTLEFVPRLQGSPGGLRVVHASHDVFVDAAVRAVRNLDCRPATGGLPIRATVEFNNGGD